MLSVVVVMIIIVIIIIIASLSVALCDTPSPLTESLDCRRFDSSRLLILRGGISYVR